VTELGDPRVQAFLATREVVVLATVEPDGAPLAMPMWFLPDPAALTMVSVAGTRKLANLVRDSRVHVVAEAGTRGDIRGVAIRGRAEILEPSAVRDALVARFLDRYRPDLERRWQGLSMPPDRVMFRIVPERVRTWGL
jgi:PPOX class probable F420-dependent enzyme